MKQLFAVMLVLSVVLITGCRFNTIQQYRDTKPTISSVQLGTLIESPEPIAGAVGLCRAPVKLSNGKIVAGFCDKSLAYSSISTPAYDVAVVRMNAVYSVDGLRPGRHHFDWVYRVKESGRKP